MQIHGTTDLIVAYNGGVSSGKSVADIISFWTNHNQCGTNPIVSNLPDLVNEGSTVSKELYPTCSHNTQVEHLKITNGGHTWPNELSLSGIGNVNKDISARKEIWRFFNQFDNPLPVSTLTPYRFKLYPNPSKDILHIEGTSIKRTLIYNMQGQVVLEGNDILNVSTLADGIYLTKIIFANHQFTTKIVEK